jgi:hypothetical protein
MTRIPLLLLLHAYLQNANSGTGPAAATRPIFSTSAFQTASPPGSELPGLLTIFLSTAGSGDIDHVVDDAGRSSTAANPDAAVDVVSYP